MSSRYFLQFGSGDPRNFTGLSPTFALFTLPDGTAVTPAPTVTEVGSSFGIYTFTYGVTTAISFLVDGGGTLSDGDRYITGALDPVQAVDDKVGFGTDSIGTTLLDPSTIFGLVKRLQELLEGDANFIKSTGTWNIYDRGGTLLLRSKDLTNTASQATKS